MEYDNGNITKYTISYNALINWRKIYLRILMLQKQIYNYTKKHRLKYVILVQNYLISSNEAKVLAIKNTLDQLIVYYVKPKYKKYYTKRLRYLNILRLFFDKNLLKCRDIKMIIEIIKQNLLLLFLEPYHKARTTLYTCKQIHQKNVFSGLHTNNLIIQSISIRNMFIDLCWNISKLQVPEKLTKLIRYWLSSGYININTKLLNLEILNLLSRSYSPYLPTYQLINTVPMANVISYIFCLDVVWFKFFVLTEKNFIIAHSHEHKLKEISLCDMFTKYFKQMNIFAQHTKNIILRYKSNIINEVSNIYPIYYNEHINYIYISITEKYNNYVNNLIYHQRRKIYLINKRFSNIVTINQNTNILVYNYNLGIYYSSI